LCVCCLLQNVRLSAENAERKRAIASASVNLDGPASRATVTIVKKIFIYSFINSFAQTQKKNESTKAVNESRTAIPAFYTKKLFAERPKMVSVAEDNTILCNTN